MKVNLINEFYLKGTYTPNKAQNYRKQPVYNMAKTAGNDAADTGSPLKYNVSIPVSFTSDSDKIAELLRQIAALKAENTALRMSQESTSADNPDIKNTSKTENTGETKISANIEKVENTRPTTVNPNPIVTSSLLYKFDRERLRSSLSFIDKFLSVPVPRQQKVTKVRLNSVISSLHAENDEHLKQPYIQQLIEKMSEDIKPTLTERENISEERYGDSYIEDNKTVKYVEYRHLDYYYDGNPFIKRFWVDSKDFKFSLHNNFSLHGGCRGINNNFHLNYYIPRGYEHSNYRSVFTIFNNVPDDKKAYKRHIGIWCTHDFVNIIEINAKDKADAVECSHTMDYKKYNLDKGEHLSKADSEKEIENLKEKLKDILVNQPNVNVISLYNLEPLGIKVKDLENLLAPFIKQ